MSEVMTGVAIIGVVVTIVLMGAAVLYIATAIGDAIVDWLDRDA
jgi:hypothetical protein